MPSADFDDAVSNAVKARCINNGQSCIAAKRFIVHEEIYDRFEQAFVARMEALHVGDPMEANDRHRPAGDASRFSKICLRRCTLRRRPVAACSPAATACSGMAITLRPAVIAGVPREAAVCREEIFGPVALLFRAASIDEAIDIANDTPFGLGASAWTARADGATALRIRAEVRRRFPEYSRRQRSASALRRHQAFGLWPRAERCRHARIHECEDGRICIDMRFIAAGLCVHDEAAAGKVVINSSSLRRRNLLCAPSRVSVSARRYALAAAARSPVCRKSSAFAIQNGQ